MKVLTVLLAMSFMLLPSCAGSNLQTWKDQVDRTLAGSAKIVTEATAKWEAAKAKVEQLEDTIALLKEKQASILKSVEAISGPLDANGDGDVTLGEAKSVITNLSKTPEGQNLLKDPWLWGAILSAVAGLGVAKKGGAVALKAVHAKGRVLVNKGSAS